MGGRAEELLGDGFPAGPGRRPRRRRALRIVYLFLAGPPDRRVELHVRSPADEPRCRRWPGCRFPPAGSSGRWPTCTASARSGTPPRRLVRHAHWPEDWHPDAPDAGPAPRVRGRPVLPVPHRRRDGVYEIPVGPVHAGLIEPGHFRFSVVGETILKLKARLWFVHRGVEKLFEGRAADGAVDLAERISGDTSAGHALAHSLAVEDACGIAVPDDVHRLRALLVELERLYNHAADLGALANDVGFGLANAHAQRIREQLLRINDAVTGHRLLRGAIHPAGSRCEPCPTPPTAGHRRRPRRGRRPDTCATASSATGSPAPQSSTSDDARDLGCLGYVARASGLRTDARSITPPSRCRSPSSPSRRRRARPLHRAPRRVRRVRRTGRLPHRIPYRRRPTTPRPDPLAHGRAAASASSKAGAAPSCTASKSRRTDSLITRAKIVDPSWFNWPALPVALADTIVPDFPLANKSFNLSYAGNDL